MVLSNFKKYKLFLFSLLFLFSSCKVALAPEYNKAIVDNIVNTSEATFVFLESITFGTDKDDFTERENTYNELIGAFELLVFQIKTRPQPNGKSSKPDTSFSETYPSAFAFDEITKTLRIMKLTDKEKGLNPTVVEAFKGQIEIFIDQAFTYEQFLKR